MILNYGVQFRVKNIYKKLKLRNYKLVPNHSFSNFQPTRQWITPWKNRKRFHVAQQDNKFFMHQDDDTDRKHITILDNKEIRKEIDKFKNL